MLVKTYTGEKIALVGKVKKTKGKYWICVYWQVGEYLYLDEIGYKWSSLTGLQVMQFTTNESAAVTQDMLIDQVTTLKHINVNKTVVENALQFLKACPVPVCVQM